MTCEKKITRAYKAKLTKAERKEFRSLMWEFRRHPDDLTIRERHRLGKLFRVLPKLKELYRIRVRFQEIFDTAPERETAARWLRELRRETERSGLDFSRFWATYDTWKTPILNYFDDHHTSAAVEGLNNKALVIIKRAYGLKSVDSLWKRLILDINRARQGLGRTIGQIRSLVNGLRAIFCRLCT
jgi:transposase